MGGILPHQRWQASLPACRFLPHQEGPEMSRQSRPALIVCPQLITGFQGPPSLSVTRPLNAISDARKNQEGRERECAASRSQWRLAYSAYNFFLLPNGTPFSLSTARILPSAHTPKSPFHRFLLTPFLRALQQASPPTLMSIIAQLGGTCSAPCL